MSKRSEIIKKSPITEEQADRIARAILPAIISSWNEKNKNIENIEIDNK